MDPARGYRDDAYDLEAFRRLVLQPLGPGGDRCYRARLHDLATDQLVDEPGVCADLDEVIVVDGSFLQGPELAGCWDETIWLDVSFATAVERAVPRDQALFGSPEAVRRAYAARYHSACRLYLDEVNPQRTASILINNEDLDHPVLRPFNTFPLFAGPIFRPERPG